MSRQYRAIWRDDRKDLISSGMVTCQDWLDNKPSLDLSLPEVGIKKSGLHEVSVDRVVDDQDDNIKALRIRLVEVRHISGNEERWITTAHWLTDGANGWIWIDLEWIADDITLDRYIYAPGLVRRLLSKRQSPLVNDNLGPEPIKVETEEDIDNLFDSLYHEKRSVPLVLYSFDNRIGSNEYIQRVRKAANRLAGCADVRMLTERTQNRFHEQIHLVNMSVFGGAVRIYLPSIDRYEPEPWKHRYIHRRYLSSDPRAASNRVAEPVLRRMIAQKPPSIYLNHIRRLLFARNRDWEVLAIELDDENRKLESEIERLQDNNFDLDDQRALAMEEAKESERDAYKLIRKLERLEKELRILGANPDAIEQDIEEDTFPNSCQEAIDKANGLSRVVIHDAAPRDIERLDRDEDSELWGQRMYRQLLALEGYAVAKRMGFEGNFRTWCDTSGDDRALHSKFIALSESESVRSSRRFMRYRRFPVDSALSQSGQIEMQSHLKVVQGGGMHVPRIYFHDDTRDSGKVHVGFIGPHDLVPNPSRN